jgi:hypothetical protein
MTSAATGAAAASRSCSAVSKTDGALPLATIAAPRPSSLPSPSLQPSSSGCDQRVLNLGDLSGDARHVQPADGGLVLYVSGGQGYADGPLIPCYTVDQELMLTLRQTPLGVPRFRPTLICNSEESTIIMVLRTLAILATEPIL